jgi:hypothetical protein
MKHTQIEQHDWKAGKLRIQLELKQPSGEVQELSIIEGGSVMFIDNLQTVEDLHTMLGWALVVIRGQNEKA